MKKIKVLGGLIALGFIFSFAHLSEATLLPTVDKAMWEEIDNADGFLIHKREVAGSDLIAFRGETVVNAPIAKVANIVIDTSRKLEWVAKIGQAKDIRRISDYERVEYNHTFSGFFLVKDRDFVFNAKAHLDRAKKRVTFRLKSVQDSKMPETDKVRGNINHGAYTLTKMGPRKTHVVVEIHADPRGSVPKWLVNLFQKAWPRKTLEGIKRQAAKADVKEHPGIKAYFENKDSNSASEQKSS